MARYHDYSKPGDKIISLEGEKKFDANASDKDADENLKKIGVTEEQLMEAIAAAQAVLDKYNVNAFVSEFGVLQNPGEKCRCGSRCVGRSCQPYTQHFPGGATVQGHNSVCVQWACNPC